MTKKDSYCYDLCIWPGCDKSFIQGTRQLSDGYSFLCQEHSDLYYDVVGTYSLENSRVFVQLATIKKELYYSGEY